MFTIPLTLAQAAASLYVLFICLMVLRAMSGSTRHLVRLAYLALSTGALCGAVTSISAPTITSAVMATGMALFLVCTERRTSCGLSN